MPRNLYKKAYLQKDIHNTAIDLLHLNESEFNNFQEISRHFLGRKSKFKNVITKKRPAYLLKDSFKTLVNTSSPSEVAALLYVEHKAHEDPHLDFNKGGGLYETAHVVLNSMWNLIGFGPEFEQIYDKFGGVSEQSRITKDDMFYAELVDQSYEPIKDRKPNVGTSERLGEFDTDIFSVWQDPEERSIHIAMRGSKFNAQDIVSDLRIVGSNVSGNEEEMKQHIISISKHFPNHDIDISAHSLAGNELMHIFEDSDEQKYLDRFERINIFNPGIMPFHSLEFAKESIEDERFYFYLNNGDVLSNTMVSLLEKDRENVHYAEPTHNPVVNHSIEQWYETV